jgi:hypothetical protein
MGCNNAYFEVLWFCGFSACVPSVRKSTRRMVHKQQGRFLYKAQNLVTNGLYFKLQNIKYCIELSFTRYRLALSLLRCVFTGHYI